MSGFLVGLAIGMLMGACAIIWKLDDALREQPALRAAFWRGFWRGMRANFLGDRK